ncbi:hypothetical protein ACTA71_011836 [Dictyostelium dimigraforme]
MIMLSIKSLFEKEQEELDQELEKHLLLVLHNYAITKPICIEKKQIENVPQEKYLDIVKITDFTFDITNFCNYIQLPTTTASNTTVHNNNSISQQQQQMQQQQHNRMDQGFSVYFIKLRKSNSKPIVLKVTLIAFIIVKLIQMKKMMILSCSSTIHHSISTIAECFKLIEPDYSSYLPRIPKSTRRH